MLYASYTGDNELVVMLYGKCSNITNPYFTWELINQDTNQKYYLNMNDHSPAPYYYNAFTFSTNSSYRVGQYVFNIYEGNTSSVFDVTNANLVKNGILNITGTYSTSNVKSFTQSNSNVIKAFKN